MTKANCSDKATAKVARLRMSSLLAKLPVGLFKAQAATKKVSILDLATERERMKAGFGTDSFADATIGRAYDAAQSRLIRIESKAVGLLAVVAVGAAMAAAALTFDNNLATLVALVSLVYLLFASVGALHLLRIQEYPQVVISAAKDPDGGRAETAAVASVIESMTAAHSNSAWGLLYDLRIGGAAALLAIVVGALGAGVSRASASDFDPRSVPMTTSEPPSSLTITAPAHNGGELAPPTGAPHTDHEPCRVNNGTGDHSTD